MTHAAHLLAKLRTLYALPKWALFTEVRNAVGSGHEILRRADALAIDTLSRSWAIHGFELKVSRGDFLRELANPQKAAAVKLFCVCWWLVVPAPWKHVLLRLSELPEGWGLLEVGPGKPLVVSRPLELAVQEEPSHTFLCALLRSAAEAGERLERDDAPDPAPLVRITRPHLSTKLVGLACGHVADRPLAKVIPDRIRCQGCAEDRPADRELVEQLIEEAGPDDLRVFAEQIARRAA